MDRSLAISRVRGLMLAAWASGSYDEARHFANLLTQYEDMTEEQFNLRYTQETV